MILIKLFKALSDETRLRIVRVLRHGSFTVNEIIFIIGGRQSNISHHLKIMLDAEILEYKKEGSWIYYRLSNTFKNLMAKWIYEYLDDADNSISEPAGDDKRVEVIYNKRKSKALEYFSSIDTDDGKKISDFMNSLFSSSEIASLMSGKFNTIADIGCGNGRNLAVLAEYADCVIGVDSSAKMIEYADHICREKGLNYKLEISDISSLPFRNGEMGAVLINMVLHHLPLPQEALVEAARVLQSDGKLFLIEFMPHDNEELRDSHADLWLGFNPDDVKGWVKDAGLEVVNFEIREHLGYQILILIGRKP